MSPYARAAPLFYSPIIYNNHETRMMRVLFVADAFVKTGRAECTPHMRRARWGGFSFTESTTIDPFLKGFNFNDYKAVGRRRPTLLILIYFYYKD